MPFAVFHIACVSGPNQIGGSLVVICIASSVGGNR